jgi:hypothetical protein
MTDGADIVAEEIDAALNQQPRHESRPLLRRRVSPNPSTSGSGSPRLGRHIDGVA